MKKNLPVSHVEVDYANSATITSATDVKGRITYVNADFLNISGFDNDELIRQSHNIVRHPDMPPAAFTDLWKTIKNGQPWMGMVKNRCKNGDHYWVDAFVTPRLENGQVIGYESVRVKPPAEYINRADQLYKKLWQGKKLFSAVSQFPLSTRISLIIIALQGIFLGGFFFSGKLDGMSAAAGFILFSLVACSMIMLSTRSLAEAADAARKIVDNPLMQRIYTNTGAEAGQLLLAVKFLRARCRTVIRRLAQATDPLSTQARQASSAIDHVSDAMQKQFAQTEQVSVAMHEMTATINEVAKNAEHAAQAPRDIDQQARETMHKVNSSIQLFDALSTEVATAEAAIAAAVPR